MRGTASSGRGAPVWRWVQVLLVSVLAWGSLLAGTGTAQAATPEEKAAAEALFDEGLKLLKAGNIEPACKKLESSQRIDPAIGTLLYLAECYEKAGRTASAWATFREAASEAQNVGQTERARVGTERAARLEPKLSKLTVELAETNMSIEGLQVMADEQAVTRSLWGSPLPLDPGPHVLKAMAPGYEPIELKVTVAGDGQAQTVQIGALKKLPDQPKPAEDPQGTATKDEAPSDGSTQRTVGIISAAVGVVGLGVGGVFGILAIGDNGTAKDNGCTPADCTAPSAEGIAAANRASDEAMVSTVAFIAGGALTTLGVVLYFTAPDAPASTALRVTPTYGGAALSWGGSF